MTLSPPIDPATGLPLQPDERRRGLWPDGVHGFNVAIDEDHSRLGDNRFQSMVRDSSLAITDRGYQNAFAPGRSAGHKAGYVLGRLTKDVISDGSRIPWWVLNHPMAITAVASDFAADAAGLNPDYDVYEQKLQAEAADNRFLGTIDRTAIDSRFASDMGFAYRNERGIPLGIARRVPAILAASALLATSGNSHFHNIAGGGRVPGFQSVLPSEHDDRISSNPIAELGARYLFGRTGRLLDWEEFTQERPDVSPQDYDAYKSYQWSRGPALGLVKGTGRNIDGEPEAQLMGFRVPLSAGAATAGALGGVVAGARIGDVQFAKLRNPAARGPRRLAGAALGGIVGAIASNLTARVVNDAVIQPQIAPDRVAAERQWRAEQQQNGLLR